MSANVATLPHKQVVVRNGGRMKLMTRVIVVAAAATAALTSSLASADYRTRLTPGKSFSVSASQCRLSILRDRPNRVSIKCSRRGYVPKRSSRIELTFGQKVLLGSKSCALKVFYRSSSLVRVACPSVKQTPPAEATPSTITTLPFLSNGVFGGRCYLNGQDTGEVVDGSGYCSANGLRYVAGSPANGFVNGALYQKGVSFNGVYPGGFYSEGIKLTSSGDLDKETFQGKGFTRSNVGLAPDIASVDPTKIVIQKDSRIVVVGFAMDADGQGNPVILRFLPDGSPDTTFGTGGAVLLPRGYAVTSAFEFGGKLVFGANDRIIRLNSDGTVDTSFGRGGEASLADVGHLAYTRSVALQTDGKMVVVGRILDPLNRTALPIVVTRFKSDGSTDTTFATAGRVIIDDSADMDGVGITAQSDNKILISRSGDLFQKPTPSQDGIYRLNPDGTPDTSFGVNGKAVIPNAVGITSITSQKNGGVVVAFRDTIYRLTASGTVDSDFGIGGVSVLPGLPGEYWKWIGSSAPALQEDGGILFGGTSESRSWSGGREIIKQVGYIVRLTSTGAVDMTFGSTGTKSFDFVQTGATYIHLLAVQGDGRIVGAASAVDVDTRQKIFVFRLWP